MKEFLRNNSLKRASFTVEAAYIVPLCAIVIALLIGFNYNMHEKTRNKALAYEAALYAASGSETPQIAEDRINSVIENGTASDPLGVSVTDMSASVTDGNILISYGGSVLADIFGDLFSDQNTISVPVIHTVRLKRFEWVAKNAF